LGLVKRPVTINAPGGALEITVDPLYNLTMKGAVAEVARGQISQAFIDSLR